MSLGPDQRAWARMQIPKRHWPADLSRVPSGLPHFDAVSRYCGAVESHVCNARGGILWGDYSTGKSALAAVILKAAWKSAVEGYWISGWALTECQIHGTWHTSDETVLDHCRRVPLLVLDELAFTNANQMGFAEHVAEALIRERVDACLTTIITTNIKPQRWEEGYPALYAVLREVGPWLLVDGYDWRKDSAGLRGGA